MNKFPNEPAPKIYRCKHCKVEVVSKDNHHAKLGLAHKKSCPRARSLN